MGITAQQLAEMERRLSGRRRPRDPAVSAEPSSTAPLDQVILGIDPSLRGTGYGVIRSVRPDTLLLAEGTISCPANWPRSRCLARIATTLREIIQTLHPTVCVVEGLFYAQNLRTALILGEARGAALAVAGEAALEIFEIAPRKVKQAIVGYGAAQKSAVARMVQRMLGLDAPPKPDAADALALALVHAQTQGGYQLTAPETDLSMAMDHLLFWAALIWMILLLTLAARAVRTVLRDDPSPDSETPPAHNDPHDPKR